MSPDSRVPAPKDRHSRSNNTHPGTTRAGVVNHTGDGRRNGPSTDAPPQAVNA